jgi:trimeric autotransporter adhesin
VVKTLGSVLLLITLGCTICGKFFRGNTDIVALSISPINASIQLGNTQQFSATGTNSNGITGNVTSQTVWTSSNPAIATINSAGLATGIASGTVTISGNCQCYVTNTNLFVSSQVATITSIAVTPSNPTINIGPTQQLTAMATNSNGTKSDVTSSVTWTSSDSTIATVTSGGLSTGASSGSATITATSGSISGSTTLTVQ